MIVRALPPITLGDVDHRRLRALLDTRIARSTRGAAAALAAHLDHARVVPSEKLPRDVVAVGAHVLYDRVGASGELVTDEATIVYPWSAEPRLGAVSVLAPLGTALLGRRVGARVRWRTPLGVDHEWIVRGLVTTREAIGNVP